MKLKEIADLRTGLVLARKKGDIHDKTHRVYGVVSLKAFSDTAKLLADQADTFVANGELDPGYLTQKGDVLVRLREPNLAVRINTDDTGLVIPSHVAIIRTGDPKLDTEYLARLINSGSIQKKLRKESKGTTIPMIKTKDLSDLDIELPSLERQNRTLDWLRLADREMALLDALKAAKNRYKNELFDTIIQQGNKA